MFNYYVKRLVHGRIVARVVIAAIIILSLVVGCGKVQPTATPTPTQTPILSTNTPLPPTATPVPPTATPTITPIPPTPTVSVEQDTQTLPSAPGGLIAFYSERDGNTEIYTMNPDGSDQRRLTFNQFEDYSPVWSPDGSQIAFLSDRDDPRAGTCFPDCLYQIYVINADGSAEQKLVETEFAAHHPDWRSDGAKLSFDSESNLQGDIYVVNADGSDLQLLIQDGFWADWSPDGAQIVFGSKRDGNVEIYVADSDGSNQRRLTENTRLDYFPAWSPDGQRIAFATVAQKQIYVVNADGSNEQSLTDQGRGEDPDWSPDGTRIVFQSSREGNFEIYTLNVEDVLQGNEDSALRRLTDTRVGNFWPSWGPAAAQESGTILFSKSEQTFPSVPTWKIGLADFDGDGDLDAVFANGQANDSQVWLNDGSGLFTATGQQLGKYGHGVDAGDIDGDGDLDVIISSHTDSTASRVYLNDGNAVFQELEGAFDANIGFSVDLFDIDGDGDLDAVGAGASATNVYLNDGAGTFYPSETILPLVIAWGDLDSDGDVDVFCKEDGVGYQSMLNDGTGNFPEHWAFTDSSAMIYGDIALGDVDNDGDLDAIVTNGDRRFTAHPALVFLNDGAGQFADSGQRLCAVDNAGVSLGDLNGDGYLDLVFTDLEEPNQIWINAGAGQFIDSGFRFGADQFYRHAHLGDLDQDGDLDIFLATFGSNRGPNEIWFNSGTSAAAPPSETPLPQPEPLPLLAKWSGTQGPVLDVDWSPDGRTIATTGRRHVRLWDGETYEELALLQGFDGLVWSASWSPDGSLLAVASVGEPIRLYDASTYTMQSTIGEESAHQVAWSPDGKLLAAGTSLSRNIQVWNVETGELASELKGDSGVTSMAWSPDGRTLAVGQLDAAVTLWNVNTRSQIRRLIDGEDILIENEAHSLAWSPDGRLIAYIQRHDGSWRIWDTQTGKLVRRVSAHNSWGLGVAWSPNRPLLASVGWDKAVRIWDIETGQAVGAGECGSLAFYSVDWSPDGQRVVAGRGLNRIYNSIETICVMEVPSTNTPLPPSVSASPSEPSLPQPEPLPVLAEWQGTQGPVYSVDWSPDGRVIATTGRRHVRLWDGETYQELATLEGFAGFVWSARWSPDGSLLAVASVGEPVRLYDARAYALQSTVGEESAHHVAWSPDGKLLAAGTAFSRNVQVWDVETGELASELNGDFGVSGLAWSPDGRTLAVGQYDAAVTLWNTSTRSQIRRLIDGKDILAENEAQSLAWSPDGRLIAYIQRHDGGWRLWDTQTGELLQRVPAHNSWGLGLAWSPNRPLLVSVGWDSAVRFWDVATGQAVGAGECDSQAFHSVAWSPDGQRVVAGRGLYHGWNTTETLCVVQAPSAATQASAGQTMSVTIVYDNTAYDPNLQAEWGFAAWIEYGGHTLLFDTGGDSSILLGNMEKLGLDPQQIEIVVLSHIHTDHTGGLEGLLDSGTRPTVYVPALFPASFKEWVQARTELVEVQDELEILPGLHSTGELRGTVTEQALVLETSEGLVVITGCAHPGIVRIVRKAREIVDGDVALVMGGFHLGEASRQSIESIISDLHQLGVRQVSPMHCTGESAIALFAEAFGEDYLPGGAGRVFVVGSSD